MNAVDITVIVLAVGLVIFTIVYNILRKKKGKSGCGNSGCDHCGHDCPDKHKKP